METNVEEIAEIELATFFIPVANSYLLVPNVTVAEIIPFQTPAVLEGTPDWLLGQINWRGQDIPLIAFEVLNGEQAMPRSRYITIAVLNGISGSKQLPFYALVTHGAPRLMRLEAEEIINMTHQQTGLAEHMIVSANGEIASIPDVFLVEKHILGASS